MSAGTLYGVGVGPGAPDLITMRAHRIITQSPVIAWPAPDTGDSFARSIVAELIGTDTIEIAIRVPMRVERFPAAEVYDHAAGDIAAHLQAGRDVAVLCEGDPFFYGSFMYLFGRLADRFRTQIVPGVSSLVAAAGALGQPLAARNAVLTVIPAPLDDALIARHLDTCQAAAIIKVGRHLPRIRALLDRLGLTDAALYAERVSLETERLSPLADLPDATAPYFSIILVQKDAEALVVRS